MSLSFTSMPMHDPDPNARRNAWAVLALALSVRLAVAALVPLAPDETYYWEWSRRLAPGFLDHPPAIAFFIRAGTLVFGATPLGVRLGAVLAGAMASVAIVRVAGSLGGDSARLRAAMIIACMPLAQLGLSLATPDAPLLLFWSLALAVLVALFRARPDARAPLGVWAMLGVSLGLALESKYTAILLCIGLGGALAVSSAQRRVLATPGPWLATALAAAVFAPNLVWNARHGWASMEFQLTHGLAVHRGTALTHELRLLGAQIGLVTPLLLVALFAAVRHALHDRRDAPRRTFAIVATVTWLFFVATALRAAVEPNWQAPAYLSAIALAASDERVARWTIARVNVLRAAIALAAATTLAIYLHAIVPFIPVSPALDATAAGFGWRELAARVDAARTGGARDVTTWVGGERYQEASELAFHLADHPVTFTMDVNSRPNQYDFWPSFPRRAHAGDRLVLVLGLYARPEDDAVIAALAPHFARASLREVVALRRGSIVRASRRIWVLDGWHGSWPTALAH